MWLLILVYNLSISYRPTFQNVVQRKIPVVFNLGQKNGSISGLLLEKPASGQKNVLIYGRLLHKACVVSPLVWLAQLALSSCPANACCVALRDTLNDTVR